MAVVAGGGGGGEVEVVVVGLGGGHECVGERREKMGRVRGGHAVRERERT